MMQMDFTKLSRADLQFQVEQLLRDYAETIDEDRLEDWPDFFTADGLYEIISMDNVKRNLPAHAMRCDSAGMMKDRIISLREANIFAEQRYRHLVSNVNIKTIAPGTVKVQSNYVVIRTLSFSGDPEIFSAGKYQDVITTTDTGPKFKERRVMFDNDRIHSLIAIPL